MWGPQGAGHQTSVGHMQPYPLAQMLTHSLAVVLAGHHASVCGVAENHLWSWGSDTVELLGLCIAQVVVLESELLVLGFQGK